MAVKLYHLVKTYRNYLALVFPISIFYAFCTHHGNLHSPDSELYLLFAKNLIETGKLIDPYGNPLIAWPPVYILALTPTTLIPSFVFWLHFILLILHQLIWLKIYEWVFKQQETLFIPSLLLGLNTLVLMTAVYVWSEMLFMVLFSFALLCLLRFQHHAKKKWLVLFGLSLFISLLTRNAGVFFLPALIGYGWFQIPRKNRILYFSVLFLAASGNLFWNIHKIFLLENQSLLADLLPELSLIRNLQLVGSELTYNFIPGFIPAWIAALLFFLFLLFYTKTNFERLRHFPLLFWVFMSYVLFWIVIPASKDDMGRLLTPIIPIYIALVFGQMQDFRVKIKESYIFYGISYYLILFSLIRIIRNTLLWSSII
jgi:hypothetical protein